MNLRQCFGVYEGSVAETESHVHGQDRTTCLLEVISNQLQLENRQAWLDKRPSDPYREHIERQIEALRIKIINQRVELGIAVDGV